MSVINLLDRFPVAVSRTVNQKGDGHADVVLIYPCTDMTSWRKMCELLTSYCQLVLRRTKGDRIHPVLRCYNDNVPQKSRTSPSRYAVMNVMTMCVFINKVNIYFSYM